MVGQVEKYFWVQCTNMVPGIPRDVRNVIDSGDFTFEQLWDIRDTNINWVKNKNDNRIGVYLLLFKGIDKDQGEDSIGFYGGKSLDVGKRRGGHQTALQSPKSVGHLYHIGRRAKAHKMLLLCDLSKVSLAERNDILRIAEHTCVSLFRTWAQVLLSLEFEDADQAAKHYFDFAMAKAYCSVADKVFEKTGWCAPPGRKLNWRTPLSEMLLHYMSLTCTVITTEETGPIRTYRTPSRRTCKAPHTKMWGILLFNGGTDGRARVKLSVPDAAIENGKAPESVHVVIEIYTGAGRRHPFPFARLPEPGPFTKWEDLNRMGKLATAPEKYF